MTPFTFRLWTMWNVAAPSCLSSQRLLDHAGELEGLKHTGSLRAAIELHKSHNNFIKSKQIAFDSVDNSIKSQEVARVEKKIAV